MRGLAVVFAGALGCTTLRPDPAPTPAVAPARSEPRAAEPSPAAVVASAEPRLVSTETPSRPPEQPDSEPVTDGDVTVGWVGELRVIVKRVPRAELVAIQLNVLGGVRNWSREDEGIEQLALAVATSGGTEGMDKEALARKLADAGATLGFSVESDYSALRVKGLRRRWVSLLGLLVDTFLRPALPAAEVDFQRRKHLTELKRELDGVDGRLRLIAQQATFKGHPYERRVQGSLESVSRLTAADLRKHLAQLRAAERLVLVVVGDIEPTRVFAQAKAELGALPRSERGDLELSPITFSHPRLFTFQKNVPAQHVLTSFLVPGWAEREFATALVSMSLLEHRALEELGTRRSIVQRLQAEVNAEDGPARGTIAFEAADANAAMKALQEQIRRLQNEAVPAAELAAVRSTFVTHHLLALETVDAQAALLSRAQLLGGHWRAARLLQESLRNVGPADVQAFARKYMVRLQTVVVGNPAKLDNALFGAL